MKRIANKVVVLLVFLVSFQIACSSDNKPNSEFEGVQIGVITYSYRKMPNQSLDSILSYTVQSGISSVELMGNVVEEYAGIPNTKDNDKIKEWRTTVPMDSFKSIRKKFEKKGVKIDLLKLGRDNWTDEEIDYAFNVCRTLGARGLTTEVSEEAAKRFAPFAEKHNLYIVFHNHYQPSEPDFSFDRILSYGSMNMLNFDVGHYFGSTGKDPRDVINRLHDRIASLHMKDKTGPNVEDANKNREFGSGETPVVEILQLIKENNWPITCDIELEYSIPENSNSVQEVRKCVDYCRNALVSN